jgi:pSer/pThr/pTyr-binding forkhead associated (FHA) protein
VPKIGKQTAVARKPVLTTTPGTAAAAPGPAARSHRTCNACQGTTPVGFAFCQHCGTRLDAAPSDTAPSVPATLTDAVADTLSHHEAIDVVPLIKKRAQPAAEPWGILIAVLRDGSDGERYPMTDDAIDIGRTDGTFVFDDRFLAPRHARVQKRGPGALVTPLEHTNGVYFKLRSGEGSSIVDGDQILLGKEVLRFEVVEPEERAQNTAIQHGVRLFGSPVRSPWGRLRQIVQSGVARDVYHLSAAEVILGREEGDLRFTDDEFMSRRHAKISNADGRFEIADLESSNGTFLRVRGDRALKKGDVIRLGDQLFRFEPAS